MEPAAPRLTRHFQKRIAAQDQAIGINGVHGPFQVAVVIEADEASKQRCSAFGRKDLQAALTTA